MAQIRPEQMDVMGKAVREDFHRRLMKFLREELPEETAKIDDSTLLTYIAESEGRAAVFDITSQAGISQFVCLTFLGGRTFDQIPEVHQYLLQEDPEMHVEDKVEVLIDEIAAQNKAT